MTPRLPSLSLANASSLRVHRANVPVNDNELGRISGITTQNNSSSPSVTVFSNATYMPFGGLSGGAFGNGAVLTIGYDQDYELNAIKALSQSTAIQNLSLGYDAASNILSITDNLNNARSQTLAYDDLNRLWCATGLYGTQAYTYDGVGNRASLSAGGTIGTCPSMSGGTTSTYAIASAANQVNTITTGSNVRTFGYAASGQVTGDQRTSSSDYTFGYNNDGRLVSASLNSTGVGSYTYNGFEQRAAKTASGLTTNFVYDGGGHMIAEENGSTGAAIREYIWLDNLPVAMVDDTGSSPVVYYIHADQLGTPQKISDGNANVVWDGVFDPFGNAVTVSGTNWGTGVWANFTWEPTTPEPTLLRFPGQYADAETALNQNWRRDYDPTIGRYVESDPIGLAGGTNTYSYVFGDPVNLSDPTGLAGSVTPQTKAYICSLAKKCNYNIYCIWRLADEARKSDLPSSWNNPTYRQAENWAYAAGYGSSTVEIYLWAYHKYIALDPTTPFSQEALDAGLEGMDHFNQSPYDLKKWCDGCGS
jgi:RHS repeat-associated protein